MKSIMFVPEYILTNTIMDKRKLMNCLNTFFKNLKETMNVEEAIKQANLIGMSKKDLAAIAACSKETINKITETIPVHDYDNDYELSYAKSYHFYNELEDDYLKAFNILTSSTDKTEERKKLFNEVLSFYKYNTYSNTMVTDFRNSYEVVTDANYISFVMKTGFTEFYKSGECGGFIIASLLRYDGENCKNYINVLMNVI